MQTNAKKILPPTGTESDLDDVAIASSVSTLEDLLKTDICREKKIHCQFPSDEESVVGLIRRMNEIGVIEVAFSNNFSIQILNRE